MRSWMWSIGGSLTCLALLAGCAKESPSGAATGKGAGQGTPVPVLVAPVAQRDVPIEIRNFGYVEANLTASVRAQITGTLMTIHFTEGQNVKKGDLLFSIDPRPFEAAIRQAEANLARDKAEQQNAAKEAQRQKELLAKGIASQGEYDTAQTTANALGGTVGADEAAIDRAKIDLGYCSIYSPIDGRAGAWLIHQGNLVKANDTALVVVNQVRPIQVSFPVPQEALADIQKQMASRKLGVRALIPGQEDRPEVGELTFVDNTVDRTTGTIQLKATFPNAGERLWPGLYVNVALVLSVRQGAILAPSRALQTGQKGTYVFAVKADGTVEDRVVTVDRPVGDDTIVSKGLAPGETVVIDGQLRLVPGAKVVVKADLNQALPAQSPQAPKAGAPPAPPPASAAKGTAKS